MQKDRIFNHILLLDEVLLYTDAQLRSFYQPLRIFSRWMDPVLPFLSILRIMYAHLEYHHIRNVFQHWIIHSLRREAVHDTRYSQGLYI